MAKPKVGVNFEILRYSPEPVDRGKIRRRYAHWRVDNGLPARCDVPQCQFHTEPLCWNGKPLPFILDHKNGNKLDNGPSNLRYMCPNCDAQLPTRGGANRGRVMDVAAHEYTLNSPGGIKHFHIFPRTGGIRAGGSAPVIFVSGQGGDA
jgi:hypothetical protein